MVSIKNKNIINKVKEKLNTIFDGEGYRLKFLKAETCDISNYISYATAIRWHTFVCSTKSDFSKKKNSLSY